MKKNKIAVAQFSTEKKLKNNLEKVEVMLALAAMHHTKMVLFPEEFLTHKMSADEKKGYAKPLENNLLIRDLGLLAKKHQIAILAGSLPSRAENNFGDKYYNTSVLFNASGEVSAYYHKIHLFDVRTSDNPNHPLYQESSLTCPGKEIIVVDTDIGKLGLSICYDIRFPELYRNQTKQGVQVIAIPSAFTVETGQLHWEVLLKARAIENLSYVLAPAQMGDRYDGRKTYGHAMIVSPWGEIISHSLQEGLIYAEIDLRAQTKLRERFPALSHMTLM
jgi:predicted amidohydrolase